MTTLLEPRDAIALPIATRRHIAVAILCGVILAIIVTGFAYIQVRTFTPAYREPDPDGYFILAKRMAEGGPLGVVDADPFQYQTHVWVENDRGEILPKFAPGYSAIMALFYKLSGNNDEAMFAVSPAMGGLAIVGAFFLFRRWLPTSVAMIATATFAFNPAFVFYSSYALAHATDICFVTWGMFFLWSWLRGDRSSPRADLFYGIFAGLTLGYACLVRHTSTLLALAVIAAIVARLYNGMKRPPLRVRSVVAIAIAYAIFPALLAAYNWRFFGSPFRTGYDLSGEQLNFGWDNLVDHFMILGRGLSFDLLFMLFPMGLIAIFFVGPPSERVMRAMWFVPLYIAYSAYYWAPENMAYYRFLLPVIPLFVGAAFMLLQRLDIGAFARIGVMLVICVMVVMQGNRYLSRAVGFDILHPTLASLAPSEPRTNNPHCAPLVDAARAVSAALRDDAVIFGDWNVRDHVGTRKHFRLYPLAAFAANAGKGFQSRPTQQSFEPLMQDARRDRLKAFYNSHTVEELHRMEEELIRQHLDAGRQVVFFISNGSLAPTRQGLGNRFELSLIQSMRLKSWGQWGLYEVKIPVPASQPTPGITWE